MASSTRNFNVAVWLLVGQVLLVALLMPSTQHLGAEAKEHKLVKAVIDTLVGKKDSEKSRFPIPIPYPLPGKLATIGKVGEVVGSMLAKRKLSLTGGATQVSQMAANTSYLLRMLNLFDVFRQQTKYSKVYDTINKKQLHQYKKTHHRLAKMVVKRIIKVASTKNTLNHRAQTAQSSA